MPFLGDGQRERRVFERFSARFPAKLKDARQGYGEKIFLRDASASGARIFSKERFFIDDQLSLEVELPDGGQPLVLDGRVARCRLMDSAMWDIGLQFAQAHFLKMQRLFKLTEELAHNPPL